MTLREKFYLEVNVEDFLDYGEVWRIQFEQLLGDKGLEITFVVSRDIEPGIIVLHDPGRYLPYDYNLVFKLDQANPHDVSLATTEIRKT